MMIEFTNDFKEKLDYSVVNASVSVAMEYYVAMTIDDFPYLDMTSKHGQGIRDEVLEKLKTALKAQLVTNLKQVSDDEQFIKILLESITNFFMIENLAMRALLSTIRHEHSYFLRVLNDYSEQLLVTSGMWTIEVSSDDKKYLEPFICDLKLRYSKPLQYNDYITKYNLVDNLLKAIRAFSESRGSISLIEEINKVTNINKLITQLT